MEINNITPEEVSELISFDRDNFNWSYNSKDRSMPALQAEGVAGLWNKLNDHHVALLADEVGTGKTLQALGVMVFILQSIPNARILVMAPNRDICTHWENEYDIFIKSHYKKSDESSLLISDSKTKYKTNTVSRLNELPEAVKNKEANIFFTTIHALSGLVETEEKTENKSEMAEKAAEAAHKIHSKIKENSDGKGFDLIIIDEAHYFRNSQGNSQRVNAAKTFFDPSNDRSARLGQRALLMTATPSHKSMKDVPAMLSYFTDVSDEKPNELLERLALRRLRRMQGKTVLGETASYDKYSYRHERALPATFKTSDPKAEMFFAIYQKRLVEDKAKEGRRYLYGYLEGFESFDVQKHEDEPARQEDEIDKDRDFKGAQDTKILQELATILGQLPAHPKYGALIEKCIPDNIFSKSEKPHEYKHLVFVRRIPSVREIAKRVNAAYDELMGNKIAEALEVPSALVKQWQKSNWSREEFNNLFKSLVEANESDEFVASLKDAEDGGGESVHEDEVEEHDSRVVEVQSRIAELFVVKKTGDTRSTDCSNFRLRLRKPDSLFSLLLEPASDYKEGTYSYYYDGKRPGEKEYTLAALDARNNKPSAGETEILFDEKDELPTLWGLIYEKLTDEEKSHLMEIIKDKQQAERLGHYIKNGFLFASPVIVELYCWFTEFCKKKGGGAQQRYTGFINYIKDKIYSSLALTYFKAALETFNSVCENFKSQQESNWKMLTGLTSPAYFASGEVTNRQRLIFGFNTPFYPNVLAATSVLQEGVNLHLQCRKVHHYGIAWTAGDNEQRVGRVDRLFGKVNSLLQRNGKAELDIYYPYLANSFDEDQLAAFIREKHRIEKQMDACQQPEVSTEIELLDSVEDWNKFLRKPIVASEADDIIDPYPYRPDSGVAK